MTPQSDVQVFRFRPAPERSEPTPCSCAYRKNTLREEFRVACGHVEHATLNPYFGSLPVECRRSVVSKAVGGRGSCHLHSDERAKVMAKLESQLQRDGFVLVTTEPDRTLVYEQRTQPKRGARKAAR